MTEDPSKPGEETPPAGPADAAPHAAPAPAPAAEMAETGGPRVELPYAPSGPDTGRGSGTVVGLYSFPKSGNTWLRAIIASITGIQAGPGMMQRYVTDSHYGPVINNPWGYQGRDWYFYKSHRREVMTEHEGQTFATDRVVHINRHPLDVFMSYLNFVSRNVSPNAGKSLPVQFDRVDDLTPEQMETLFAIFLEHATLFPKNRAFGSVFDHAKSFRRRARERGDVLDMRYEDLSTDFEAQVRRLCDFLGFRGVDPAEVFRIADRRTLQNGKFFWKRQTETFRSYLTDDQIARFETKHAAAMAAMGYGPDAPAGIPQDATAGAGTALAATPPKSAAIYTIVDDIRTLDHVTLAIDRLRTQVDRIVLVTAAAVRKRFGVALEDLGADRVIEGADKGMLPGYRAGLAALREMDGDAPPGTVIVTGAHVFGPVLRAGEGAGPALAPSLFALDAAGVHVQASSWIDPALDPQLRKLAGTGRMAQLDFAVFAPALTAHPAFRAFWEAPVADGPAGAAAFTAVVRDAGLILRYDLPEASGETARPAVFEIHKILAEGGRCLPVSAFLLDPVLHDLNAIRLRDAVDDLRRLDPPLYAAAIRYVTRHMQPRDFATVADQYEIFSETAAGEPDRLRDFGPPAVFIHAFYATMMPEFWSLIQRLPHNRRLYITTASEEHRESIRTFLGERGEVLGSTAQDDIDIPPRVTATVRVVAQNRGRDMASLFITWRDIVLSGRHEVALRLHSKRTPQVSRQVGEEFKAHLFDNLVASRGYVSNLLDRMEAEPDIGLVVPPLIHTGFGTLGHSWFANKAALGRLCGRLGIDVALDDHTPLAPNGTMYWFRFDALRLLFETEWAWEDYNAEPNHIDGGLAHVQERLIGYAAQDRGFRILQTMAPGPAARGYARLEYKLALLASELATGNIWQQREQLRGAAERNPRMRLYRGLVGLYARIIVRFPGVHGYIAPTARRIARLLGAEKR